MSLQWRHNEYDGVSYLQPHDCLLNRLNINVPRHWPLRGKFTDDRWIPFTKGQQRRKCFHLMTSSWNRVAWIVRINISINITRSKRVLTHVSRFEIIIITFHGLQVKWKLFIITHTHTRTRTHTHNTHTRTHTHTHTHARTHTHTHTQVMDSVHGASVW